MKLKTIFSDKAPAAIGPYSQAVQAGNMLFCSGQIALDPSTGEMVQGDVVVQAERVMENIAAVLTAAGAGFDNVVKTTIFLVEMGDFAAVNEIYGRYFSNHKPARSTVAVKSLPRGALVEIETVACL
ncbi:MAG: reactive intermediate/imine deaminase [Desulfuromonadaceae bacterium GWB2_53_15]|nr:MAG: reactive intermediate/imine deaminase [Desulfuromonadales bacterium GWD2_54_10]OHB24577.1 MAG: reactive intermediate/imine deaminase [Desulfuromonadaceae bacterium GWB2_53_15]